MKLKKVQIISPRVKKILENQSVKHYLGKNIVSKSGDIVGKVKDVIIGNYELEGIIFDKNFLTTFVDKRFIKEISNSVMLSIDPVTSLKGKYVFDANGKKLGKIIRINRKGTSNSFTELIVKKRAYSKKIEIPKKDVLIMKKIVILNKSYE